MLDISNLDSCTNGSRHVTPQNGLQSERELPELSHWDAGGRWVFSTNTTQYNNSLLVSLFLTYYLIQKQGDLDDALEIIAVWTYFRDNQVENSI